jgi:hypothetical protein
MAISALQRNAFMLSVDFTSQVNQIVVREALYKFDTIPDLDAVQRDALTRAAQRPETYNFAGTITADASWGLTYDVWAANPIEQEGVIGSAVGHWFNFLTGFYDTPPEA